MTINQPRDLNTILAEEEIQPENPKMPNDYPYHIAFVIDGVVRQVFHVEEKLAAILLSNPLVVQCSSPSDGGPDNEWTYNPLDNTFSAPITE